MRTSALIVGCCIVSNAHGEERSSQTSNAFYSFSTVSGPETELAIRAIHLIGTPYKYGGNSPENGMDCSGLVRYVFRDVTGAELPRTSHEISQIGEKIHLRDLRSGDLVFYNTLQRAYSHVGIYLGDSKFIHAPSSNKLVRVESMDLKYWKKRFNGARRINVAEQQMTLLETSAQLANVPIGWQE